MKTLSNLLSLVGIFFLMTTLMAVGCQKEPILPTGEKPSIQAVNVSTTMNSATINVVAKNYSSMTATLDGGSPVNISGAIHTVNGLSPNKSYVVVITATNSDGSTSYSQSFATQKSSLSVKEFKVADSTTSGASFVFSAEGNATVVSQTLVNVNTSESIDVTNKTTHSVDNLVPDSSYTFTFKVKDNTGNEVSQNVTFKTKEKASEWFSTKKVTYEYQFDIIGNAVSAKLTIETNNSASSAKTLDYLSAGFGEYGKAVKMLRYSLNGGNWVRSIASPEGVVAFTNVTLQPGDNTFESYFSLKPNVGGVPNNSPLSFSFIAMNDREGGTLPKGGSFPAAVPVGGVNATVQPTIITSNWNGYMYVGGMAVPEGSSGTAMGIYQTIAIRATGPAGARFASVRLKNPYTSFSGMVFGYNNQWMLTIGTGYKSITNFSWQGDYINLTLPNDNNAIITNGSTNNDYYINCAFKNNGPGTFFTGDFTPGLSGFYLASKYDLVILNSNGQPVDLSDVTVLQEGKTIN